MSESSLDELIDELVAIQKERARVDAWEARVLALVAALQSRKNFVREEVACALRLSFNTAASRLHEASVLVNRLPVTLAMMAQGGVNAIQTRYLVDAVDELDAEATAAVEQLALARADQQTAAEFRRSVRKAVHAVDGRGVEEKHQRAVEERRVEVRPDRDGMANIFAFLPAEDAETVMTAIQALADREHPTLGDRTADQRRADALVELAVSAVSGSGCDDLPLWQGRKPAVQVTVALSTLLGLDEQPGELDGAGPIPASVARRIAADQTGTWRRLVTDDVGRLIDYGRSTYRPPADLRDFVIARDRTCRMPGCSRDARRAEIDHIQDWENGGSTNADNLHMLCKRHHHVKHETDWQVTRDDVTYWTSPDGRTYRKTQELYPIDRTTESDEPPPF